jgi:EAL domain-containing protein (putative c-di-GMP-specific phosphodiesterase class I)
MDKFETLARDLGARATEELLALFPAQLPPLLGPNDLAGHFGTASLLLLLERGNARDAEAWSESLVERIGRHVFQVGERSITLSCSVGLAVVANANADLDGAIADAQAAARRCAERGGNRVLARERIDQDARVLAYDQVWVKHIKAALAENRFHLVQQPIVSLGGSARKIYDVALRMLDAQGREVLPSEFLPAAERNDLLRPIDRWVLATALASIAAQQPDQLFVRVSRDSALDATLPDWIDAQLASSRAEPQRLCLQVAAEVAELDIERMQRLHGALKQRGVRLALERFGAAGDATALLGALPVDYVKIDGSLLQGIAGDAQLQQRVRAIVDVATRGGTQTVAERIEDANTMAVVWQLGVQFIQGYLVHAPEEVVLKS